MKIIFRIFGVNAALDGVRARLPVRDVPRKRFARGDPDLFLHQIAAVNFFGNRVLNLDARVHLHEIKVSIFVDEKFDRSGVFVFDRFRQLDGRVAHFFAKRRRNERRWTFFDYFLIAPLDRAIAFAKMNNSTMTIGDDLKLNVMRIHNQLLDIDVRISERFLRFHSRRVITIHQTRFVVRGAHPTTATARNGFDHHRVTNFLRDLRRFLVVGDNAIASGCHRDAGFASARARHVFVAHFLNHVRRRPNEFDFATLDHFGKVRVLGQKTVTRMDRIDVADLGRAHDALDFQITVRARRRADANRFVGKLHVQGIDVGIGINRERADAELFACANNAQRDFTAVGNQDFFEHARAPQFAERTQLSHPEENLAELDWFTVFGHDFGDYAAGFRFDLVHNFHRLDNANHRVLSHFCPDIDKRR